MVLGRVRLVAQEGVEERVVSGCRVALFTLQPCSHAVVEDCEEVAVMAAVANGDVVLQRHLFVVGGLGRLCRRCALGGCSVSLVGV